MKTENQNEMTNIYYRGMIDREKDRQFEFEFGHQMTDSGYGFEMNMRDLCFRGVRGELDLAYKLGLKIYGKSLVRVNEEIFNEEEYRVEEPEVA